MALSIRSFGLRLPRPQTFLGLMSLQTGTELVSLALFLNKAIGIYGVLAILTGYKLSALQVSIYLWSLMIGVILAFLVPHIRKQSPFQNIALAWIHVTDTFVNAAFTTAFAMTWYRTSFDPEAPAGAEKGSDSGEGVEMDGNQAAPVDSRVGVHETAISLVLIVFFTVVRIYFSLVVMSYARMTIQKFTESHSGWEEEPAPGNAPNPFAIGSPLGEGWRGKLGRIMIFVGRKYWLGQKEDEEWTRDVSSKFKSSTA